MEKVRNENGAGERFLSFVLNKENYCIPIFKIREIMELTTITYLPHTPAFIKGIINLRGKMIPIIDLRTKFNMALLEYNERTCFIVVDLSSASEQVLIGIVVDSIKDVVNIPKEKISQVAYVNAQIQSDYIKGIAESASGIQVILDIDRILSVEEFKSLRAVAVQA